MTHYLLTFLILSTDGHHLTRADPTVQFPTRAACEAQGIATHQAWRAEGVWMFPHCTEESES